ncbi:MAG TPA: hypothetical protein V6C63_06840 [Allocoleopsis sp.]
MSEKEYPLEWVKMAADQVYGSCLSERAWRKWLRICKVKPWSRSVGSEQATWLLTLAYLKKSYPRKSIGYVHVKQQLKSAPMPEYLLQEQIDNAFYAQATGKDLPDLIRQVTGRVVTLRTLYRWADKHKLQFGASKPIPKPEVQRWIDIAS